MAGEWEGGRRVKLFGKSVATFVSTLSLSLLSSAFAAATAAAVSLNCRETVRVSALSKIKLFVDTLIRNLLARARAYVQPGLYQGIK